MKILRFALAAAVVIAPMLTLGLPAEALTARQYHAQGHGRYITSKGRSYGYSHRRAPRHPRLHRMRHHM